MTISEVFGACARRWYVLILIVALAGALGAREYRAAQPVYTVSSSVILLPSQSLVQARLPTSPTGGITTNPFTSVSTGTTLGVVVADALNKASVQDRVLAGGTGAAQASWSFQQSQLISLTTVGTDPESASQLMNLLIAGANTTAHDIQLAAGAPADQLYDTVLGSPAGYPDVSYPDQLRTVVGIALVGLALAVILALALDRVLIARSRRAARPKLNRQPVLEEDADVAEGRAADESVWGPQYDTRDQDEVVKIPDDTIRYVPR